jgi:hypothetical protein
VTKKKSRRAEAKNFQKRKLSCVVVVVIWNTRTKRRARIQHTQNKRALGAFLHKLEEDMGFAGASVGKKSEDIDVYSSFVTNFLSNACWDVHSFDQKSSREKLKAEASFLFALSNVARRHKMREVPHHKIYVWLLDIIRRDRSGSEQPLDDMNCIRNAVQILKDLFDANPNITWNSRKRELTTNIHAWTPLDSEERQGRDSANASLISPRGKTSTTVGSLGASLGIDDNEDKGQLKNTTFFVSTHHRRTGPREDWNSFVSLIDESMYTPEQIEKMNRSSRAATALRKSRRGGGKDKEKNEEDEEEEEAKVPCSYDQSFGATLLLGHVAHILQHDMVVRKAYATTERKKNSRESLENVVNIFKESLVCRLFSIEKNDAKQQAEVFKKLAQCVTRGCVEDECKLEKLLKSKTSTPEDLARFKRLDASTKELSKSAASIMSTFLSSLWALKEANSALQKKRQEERESSASLSPIGSFVSARGQTFLDKVEVEAFNTIKDVVLTFLTDSNKKNYGGCKFASNYLRTLGNNESVVLEVFRQLVLERVDTSRMGFTSFVKPAFSKSENVELAEDFGTLIAEHFTNAKAATSVFNLVNFVSSSSKVLLETKSEKRKKQKLMAAHDELEKTSTEEESRSNFVARLVLGL